MEHLVIGLSLVGLCTAVTSVDIQTSIVALTKNALAKSSPELQENSQSAATTVAPTDKIFPISLSSGATLGRPISTVTSEHISFTSSEYAKSNRTPSISTTGAFNVSVDPVGRFDAEKVKWHLTPIATRIKHYNVLNYKQKNCNSNEILDSKIDSKMTISNVTINSLIIDNLSHLTTYCVCLISIAELDEDISEINNCKGFTTDYNHMNTKAVIALGIASSFMVMFCIVVIYNVLRSAKKLSGQSRDDEELITSVYNDVSSDLGTDEMPEHSQSEIPPPTAI